MTDLERAKAWLDAEHLSLPDKRTALAASWMFTLRFLNGREAALTLAHHCLIVADAFDGGSVG